MERSISIPKGTQFINVAPRQVGQMELQIDTQQIVHGVADSLHGIPQIL
jgi:hypothetical protein